MLNLKQIFFFILGINCVFLVAFFVTVKSPDASFTAPSNAFTEKSSFKGSSNVKDTGSVAYEKELMTTIADDIQTTSPDLNKQAPATADDGDVADKSDIVDNTSKTATVTKADDTKKDEKTDNDSDDDNNDVPVVTTKKELTKEQAAIEAMNQIITTAQDKVTKAQAKLSNALRRRNKVQHVLRWNNPFFLLGGYGKVLRKYFNSYPAGRPYYQKFNYGVINDPDYCEIVDSYNLAHPENMFKTMNFFTDYAKNGLVRRDVIRKIGVDTMTRVSRYMEKKDFFSAQYHLDPTITNFFTKRVDIHIYHMLGKNFNCATQMYNHIPGHGSLKRKDLIVDSVDNYALMYKEQGQEQCFNKHTFFPYSYRLYIEKECRAFFKKINSAEYLKSLEVEPIQYLIKLGFGAHRAQGVFLLDTNYTKYMNDLYDGGFECGRSTESVIAQTYVTNPLLLDKDNKFDFRVYMLIASTNPLIVYYHDGFLRVSLETYNKNSEDRNVHLTNTHLAKDAFAQAEKENATKAQELKDYQMWTFEKLEKYLIDSGKVDDPNWLNNTLRPQFRQAFIHTTRMSAYSFWNASNVYEMFGLDFMLDDKLNLWFIECNSSPQLIGTNEHKTKFLIKMLTDLFEIQYGYYRSRMKRVLKLISKMNSEIFDSQEADYSQYKEEYKEAIKNKFEPEYELSKDNSFELIMDMNFEGPEAYFGNLQRECTY